MVPVDRKAAINSFSGIKVPLLGEARPTERRWKRMLAVASWRSTPSVLIAAIAKSR